MTPSEQCKSAGLKSLSELAKISGVSVQTLINWHNVKPALFATVVAGAVVGRQRQVRREHMSKNGIDKAAIKAASSKLRRLRLTDVGGRKERPCETVKSVLKRGLGWLYDDEAVDYILRHGVKYYLDAVTPNY